MQKILFRIALVALGMAVSVAFNQPEHSNKPSTPNPPVYTKAQIEKGKYLVGIMGCADCHAPKKMTAQGPIPDPCCRPCPGPTTST